VASYDAAINVIISGQQKVDSLISSVSKLERVIGSVKTTPIDINLGPSGNITKQLQNTQNQIKRANNQINSLYSERIKTIEKIGKLNETIIRNKQILEKSAPSTQKYKNAERVRNSAIEKQIQLQEELNDLMEKSSKISSARSSIIDSQEELQGLRRKIRIVQILANSYLEYGDARKYSEETGLGRRGDLVKNETSIAQVKQQIAGFEQLTNNAKVASREFNRFAIATELASIKAGKAQQERLRALSEAFSKPQGYPGVLASSFKQSELAGARSAVSSLVSFYPNVAKSEAALSAYAAQLENLRSLVPIASSEFIQLR
jgi:chromosome segregation ATPase